MAAVQISGLNTKAWTYLPKVRPPPSPVEVQEWPYDFTVLLWGPSSSPRTASVLYLSMVVMDPVTYDPRSGIRRNSRPAKSVRAAIHASW